MTTPSTRKLEANRRNAQRSTGPRSVEGKAQASRNAFKHGLAKDIRSDPDASDDLKRLAQALCGLNGDAEPHELALEAAAAWLELQRVKAYGVLLVEREIANLTVDDVVPEQSVQQATNQFTRLQRYQRRAASRCNKLFRALQVQPDSPER